MPVIVDQRRIDQHVLPSSERNPQVHEHVRGDAVWHGLLRHRRLEGRATKQHVRGRHRPPASQHGLRRVWNATALARITRCEQLTVPCVRRAAERDADVRAVVECCQEPRHECGLVPVVVVQQTDDRRAAVRAGRSEATTRPESRRRAYVADAHIVVRSYVRLQCAGVVVDDELEVAVRLPQHTRDGFVEPPRAERADGDRDRRNPRHHVVERSTACSSATCTGLSLAQPRARVSEDVTARRSSTVCGEIHVPRPA